MTAAAGGEGGAANRVLSAKQRIVDLLNTELAAVKPEILARLAETYYEKDPRNINPHVTGTALDELEREGKIITTAPRTTRGGAEIATIQPTDRRRRATAIDTAAARKRLLYARYLGWAMGTQRSPHGLIGPAGETAVRTAVIASAALQPATAAAGPVSNILGVTLNGAADSGGFMTPLLDGIPQAPVTVLIEVKNIREWIYPSNSELYQVLHKCLLLKRAHPTVPVLPILVCRRAHVTTFYMAQQLGFVVIAMNAQFVGSTVTDEQLLEVRNGLGFGDLYNTTGPSIRVRDRLPQLGKHLHRFADDWTKTSTDASLPAILSALRNRLPPSQREDLLNQARSANRANGNRGGW